MEVVRMFLAYAANKDFKVYQMDVKLAFLQNGELEEEVYIEKSQDFSCNKREGYGLQTKESLVWIKASTKNLVFKVQQILRKAWIY